MEGKVFFLVRHPLVEGEGAGSLKDKHDINAPLSSDGRKQIPRIMEFFRHFKASLVVAGDAPRYLEVAKPLSQVLGISLQIDPRLLQSGGSKRAVGVDRVAKLLRSREVIRRLVNELPIAIVITSNIFIQSLYFGEDITPEEVENNGEKYRTKPGCGVIVDSVGRILLPFEI